MPGSTKVSRWFIGDLQDIEFVKDDLAHYLPRTILIQFWIYRDGKVDVELGSYESAIAKAKEDAKVIAADMKNQAVKDAVAKGQIPEIVALIAYLNSLK